MYLPKFKQKAGGEIEGTLTDPDTGLRYTGAYVRDYKGNYFKGSKITRNSIPLIYNVPAKPEGKFINQAIYPTDKEIEKGKMKRYFAKDNRNGKIIELTKDSYLAENKKDKLYVNTIKLDWELKEEEDTIKGYSNLNSKVKNENTLKELEKQMPGLSLTVKNNTEQFTNLNKLSSRIIQENLAAEPGIFLYAGTNTPYSGPYHIHPILGPMVGNNHTSNFHQKLEYIKK